MYFFTWKRSHHYCSYGEGCLQFKKCKWRVFNSVIFQHFSQLPCFKSVENFQCYKLSLKMPSIQFWMKLGWELLNVRPLCITTDWLQPRKIEICPKKINKSILAKEKRILVTTENKQSSRKRRHCKKYKTKAGFNGYHFFGIADVQNHHISLRR